jgi:hypothetical protein
MTAGEVIAPSFFSDSMSRLSPTGGWEPATVDGCVKYFDEHEMQASKSQLLQ